MTRTSFVLLGIAGGVGVLIVLFVGLGFAGAIWYPFTDEGKELRQFDAQFEQIRLGDTQDRVLLLLGLPDAKEADFRLGQREGFEDAYTRAAESRSTQYLVWVKGIDIVYSVGIDDSGVVRAKESGGT